MEVFNLFGDEWDETRDLDGWRMKEVFVGSRIGGTQIGASMGEIEPGSAMWPYHAHHANEEWALVVSGEPALRTPDGERVLRAGDVVCFPRGAGGAHQIVNRSDAPVRVLMLSSMVLPDVVDMPDTGKVFVRDSQGEPIVLARRGATIDYWEGEGTDPQ
jgi:uncharacterized cupin superfamily protein